MDEVNKNIIKEKMLFLILREALKQTNNHFKTIIVEQGKINFSLLGHKDSFVLRVTEGFKFEIKPVFEIISTALDKIYAKEDKRCKEEARCEKNISCIECGGVKEILYTFGAGRTIL